MPDVELPNVEGDVNLSLKKKKDKKSKEKDGKDWEFSMPKFGFKGPKVSKWRKDGKGWGLHMPKFGFKGPKISGPDVDLGKAEVDMPDVELPKVEGD
uniref:Uncharacterized protein n=1 Tax=Sarcoptes scabiei TaxID=52283 RepID=A0A834V941_SARSC